MFTKVLLLSIATALLGACDNIAGSATLSSQETLKHCVDFDGQLNPYAREDQCSTEKLSFIGQETTQPSVAEIMNRVLVSEPWMADNFRAVLTQLPTPALDLFRTVTVIVIDARINPSHYSVYSGAIYLDPHKLWIDVEQLESITVTKDFRQSYAKSLPYFYSHRYIDDQNKRLWSHYASGSKEDRPESEAFYATSALLFHELAHANDYYSAQSLADTAVSELLPIQLRRARPSSELQLLYPQLSDELKDLGRVLFRGETFNETHAAYTAEDLGRFITVDQVSDFYAYANPMEDMAMLFEEFAMLYFLNVRREITVVDISEPSGCDGLNIGWGQISRIQEPALRDRALFAASAVLPELSTEFESFTQTFPGAYILVANQPWCNVVYQ